MIEPTPAEIVAFAVENGMHVRTGRGAVKFALAVLAKWGVQTTKVQAIQGVQWQCGPQANGFTAPQTESQPVPVPRWDEMIRQQFPDMLPKGWSDTLIRRYMTRELDAYRAARAPADSVTAPAGAGVAHALSDGQIEAMPVWRNFVGLWPESRREIVDAVVDLLTTPPTQAADSVLEDAARLDWLLLHISGAEFRRIGVHYSGNARRADVDAARKQGANHD